MQLNFIPVQRFIGVFATYIFLAILVLIPIPLGGNRIWALSVMELAIVSSTILFLLSWLFRADKPFITISKSYVVLFILWIAWLGWIGFQFVLWPSDLVSFMSPQRSGHQSSLVDAGLITQSELISISIERDSTYLHLIESVTYMILFWTVCFFTYGSRKRLVLLLWAVFISGLAQATFGSLMVLSGLELGPFGKKEHYLGSATGTFVNRNHFAGYLELALAAGIGLFLALNVNTDRGETLLLRVRNWLERNNVKILFIRIGITLIFVGLLLSRSRMGNAAALGGLALVGLLYLLIKRRFKIRSAIILFISILLIDVWFIGGWFGLDKLIERYESTDVKTELRFDLLDDLNNMQRSYSITGSGLGTFEVAYPEFQSADVVLSPKHAHNDYYQFLIEVGPPGVIILGLLVFLTYIKGILVLMKRRDSIFCGTAVASMMAITCLAIHSFSDFNLQIPANAATLIVLMAAVWACPLQSRGLKRRKIRG